MMKSPWKAILFAMLGFLAGTQLCLAAPPGATPGTTPGANPIWQYSAPVERPAARNGKPSEPGKALLWIPPRTQTVRGIFLIGRLGIERELLGDPSVRQACADCDLAMVYFEPHISGVFHFWEEGNTDGPRLLKALDDLARISGHGEISRVPWITSGHSTAGIYCRNVAYWKPDRVAAIVHVKSGNFHQKDHLPPTGSLLGIPLVAINGQFESFGPAAGIQPELGRETQWTYVLKDLQQFRRSNPNLLLSLLVEPGADHFHGTPEDAQFVALFLRKTAQYRLAKTVPAGDGLIPCLTLKAEDGWLSDPDLKHPTHPAAPYKDYTGDKTLALWHYDGEIAAAAAKFDRNLANDQAMTGPTCTFLDEGDGWTFKAAAEWLDTMPDAFGGSIGGKKVSHSTTPFTYRAKDSEPVEQLGPDTFRLLLIRPKMGVNIAAYHPGDDEFRSTVRWGSLKLPDFKGAQKQTIAFPTVPDLKATGLPYELKAKATSNLPIYYEVDQGPIVVEAGKLKLADLPTKPQYPFTCKVTAYQIGRRLPPMTEPAPGVSVEFKLLAP